MIRAAVEKSIRPGGQHGSAAADVRSIGARPKPYKIPTAHYGLPPLRPVDTRSVIM
jgi:hypothetical protein